MGAFPSNMMHVCVVHIRRYSRSHELNVKFVLDVARTNSEIHWLTLGVVHSAISHMKRKQAEEEGTQEKQHSKMRQMRTFQQKRAQNEMVEQCEERYS